jgi:hypothetical protein
VIALERMFGVVQRIQFRCFPFPKRPPPATLDLPVSMVVLRGAQAVGLGSHLSHLIYIYKLKITKYMLRVTDRGLQGEGLNNGE